MQIKQIELGDKRSLAAFINYPHRLYAANPFWIAPLHREITHKLDIKNNPFYKRGRRSIYIAYDTDRRVVGRVAAIFNPLHEEVHEEAAGFFGLFESDNAREVAQGLMKAAEEYLLEAGCDRVIGPVNLSTNDESGFLLEGFDHYPTFMCNYCHSYYHDLMDSCGYTKLNDTYSYEAETLHPFPEKYTRVVQRALNNRQIKLRHFTKKTAAHDVGDIMKVYNGSFRDTWGFVPLSQSEADQLADDLLPFVDEHLIWIATHDDQPVGTIMGFPDVNEMLRGLNGKLHPLNLIRIAARKGKVGSMRIAALGVLPDYRNMGIETLMIRRVHDRVLERPYARSEFSVVMENNQRMRNLLMSAGFKECRKYRIYGKEL
jgi:GNAT superfamily N-acetyltransferase